MTPLLDANVLIALALADHEHHDRVSAWVTQVERIALCPIVEGSLLRFLLRLGESSATATALLMAFRDSPAVDFWPDELSYADVPMGHVVGHRQITDAYLAALAAAHGSRLATLDEGLAAALPERTVLIPPEPTGT